jgi:hypothetical protein
MLSLTCSGILLLALTQSRQAWTTSLFTKAPETTSSLVEVPEKTTFAIGPHSFPETQFYTTQDPSSLLIFSFKESPNDRWLFPVNGIVEVSSFNRVKEVIPESIRSYHFSDCTPS